LIIIPVCQIRSDSARAHNKLDLISKTLALFFRQNDQQMFWSALKCAGGIKGAYAPKTRVIIIIIPAQKHTWDSQGLVKNEKRPFLQRAEK